MIARVMPKLISMVNGACWKTTVVILLQFQNASGFSTASTAMISKSSRTLEYFESIFLKIFIARTPSLHLLLSAVLY